MPERNSHVTAISLLRRQPSCAAFRIRGKSLAPLHPEWKDTQPFKAALEGDMKTLAESGEHGMAELVTATHAGMTTEEFEKIVTDWLDTARVRCTGD